MYFLPDSSSISVPVCNPVESTGFCQNDQSPTGIEEALQSTATRLWINLLQKPLCLLLLPWYVNVIHLCVSHRDWYTLSPQYPNIPAHLQAALQTLEQHARPPPAPEISLDQHVPPEPVSFAPAPFPMPPPAIVAELPEGQRPFGPTWQVDDLGHMNVVCSGCGALHWMDEKLSSSSQNNPKFGMCCFSGKMDLPKLHDPPPGALIDASLIPAGFWSFLQNLVESGGIKFGRDTSQNDFPGDEDSCRMRSFLISHQNSLWNEQKGMQPQSNNRNTYY